MTGKKTDPELGTLHLLAGESRKPPEEDDLEGKLFGNCVESQASMAAGAGPGPVGTLGRRPAQGQAANKGLRRLPHPGRSRALRLHAGPNGDGAQAGP